MAKRKISDLIHILTRYQVLFVLGSGFIFFDCNCQVVNVQDSEQPKFTIKYIGQVPAENNRKKRFSGKLGSIIAGSDPVSINKPVNMAALDTDNIWILSQGNGTVIHNAGGEMTIPRIIKRENIGYPSLVGIAMSRDGNLFFTDSKLNKVFRLSGDGREIIEINDSIALEQPTGIAYSELKDELWIVETGAHRITVLTPGGKLLKRIGTRGTGEGEFNFPTSVWIDSDGFAYVIDALNCRIEIFDSNGTFKSSFGKPGDATGYLARPKGIATDSFGNIYISDALFNAIQVFDRSGRLLYYFGSQGQGAGQFWMPSGIFVDSQNYIYIADSYNVRIQIYQIIKEGRL